MSCQSFPVSAFPAQKPKMFHVLWINSQSSSFAVFSLPVIWAKQGISAAGQVTYQLSWKLAQIIPNRHEKCRVFKHFGLVQK
jgi:hypothetical protein